MDEIQAMSAPQVLEELRACYGAFVEKLEKSRASTIGEVMGSFFRSQGNPRIAYAVEEFDAIVTGRVATLAGLLAECTAQEAGELAAQALEQMLFYPPSKDNTIAFSLAAFEGHAFPLLSYLPPELRQEMAGRYARRTPPRQMLPNQKKVWKELMRR